jgi:hypothetical protein
MLNDIDIKYSRPGLTPSQVKLFRTYIISPKTLYFKLSQNIHKHDAEKVFYWLNTRDQNIMLHRSIEIDKKRPLKGLRKLTLLYV